MRIGKQCCLLLAGPMCLKERADASQCTDPWNFRNLFAPFQRKCQRLCELVTFPAATKKVASGKEIDAVINTRKAHVQSLPKRTGCVSKPNLISGVFYSVKRPILAWLAAGFPLPLPSRCSKGYPSILHHIDGVHCTV